MPVSVTIFGKSAGGGKEHLRFASFEETEWERLKADWLSYLDKGTPKGGAYKFTSREAGGSKQPTEALLRFDDIAAIT